MNISIIGINCCGCRSCEQSCPKTCISMVENKDGFIYPKIDFSICTNCGACLKKCPINNYKNSNIIPKVYAFKSKSSDVLLSASGGACDVVAKQIINEGGIVYGVAYDNEFNAKYIRITKKNELSKIQSSKYVFADTCFSYAEAKKDLDNGEKVLYTGTSCQIDGLLHFLSKTYQNLFTISLICHGVPSPKLFKSYIRFKETQIGKKIVSYNFRSKDKNGRGCTEKIVCENGQKFYEELIYTPYGNDFLNGYSYRENCYKCKYCKINRVGDWSVGDFWGISKAHHEFADDKGISTILVSTSKGSKMMQLIAKDAVFIESNVENAILNQHNLVRPTSRNEIRDTYYKDFNNKVNFFSNRMPRKDIKYWLKKFLPRRLKHLIKKLYK